MLQANLRLLYQERGLKTIAVASAVSQEGRSTVAANLALTLSQLGYRVLLVEADLRHPVQHLVWNLGNPIGLGDVAMNPSKLSHAIVSATETLDILPSGGIADDPLALLDSEAMSRVMQEFRATYDFVILDTPPLLLVADAISLAKMTDGILLVIRPGTIDKTSATATKELLTQTGQSVLGLVVNGVKTTDELASYSYHSKQYQKADLKYARSPEPPISENTESFPRLDKTNQELSS
jgi:capsular exopolysaccharide synthesis family protein